MSSCSVSMVRYPLNLWDHEGGEEDREKSGVAHRKQRRGSRAPFRLALSGELEICMPSAGQVRTGGIQFEVFTVRRFGNPLVFSLWKNINF